MICVVLVRQPNYVASNVFRRSLCLSIISKFLASCVSRINSVFYCTLNNILSTLFRLRRFDLSQFFVSQESLQGALSAVRVCRRTLRVTVFI